MLTFFHSYHNILDCSKVAKNSSNELRRPYRDNDPMCKKQNVECPTCEESFVLPGQLEHHLKNVHDLSSSMPSLISDCNNSTWKHLSCNVYDDQFEMSLI